MNEAVNCCTKCKKPPTNPHAMLCGHIFCLHPCLLPANSNQRVVQCPLCFIETDVIHLEAITQVKPPDISTRLGSPVAKSSCSIPEPCQHSSNTVCPECVGNYESEISSHVMKKLAELQTNRAALLSLKTKLKDNLSSRKQRLLEQATKAADQLFNVGQTSLKNTQLFLESTFAKEETAIQKMKSNLAKLKKMRIDLWQMAFNVRKEVSCRGVYISRCNDNIRTKHCILLTKLKQSTKLLLSELNMFRKLVGSIDASGTWNLMIAQNFRTIQLLLQDFHLLIVDSVCAKEVKPPIPPLTEAKCPSNPSLKRKLDSGPVYNRIFIGDLPVTTKHYDLQEYFSQFGSVQDVVLLRPAEEQTPRRCGFVGFLEWSSVRKALEFHPHFLKGTRITVSLPRTKRMRTSGPAPPADKSSAITHVSSNVHPAFGPIKSASTLFSSQIKLFVGQLHPKTTVADLSVYFSQFGSVKDVEILPNMKNSPSGNYGFITFAGSADAKRDLLHGEHFLHDRLLNIKIAKPLDVQKGNIGVPNNAKSSTQTTTGQILPRTYLHPVQCRSSSEKSPVQLGRRSAFSLQEPPDQSPNLTDLGSPNHPASGPLRRSTAKLSNHVKFYVARLNPTTTASDLKAYFSRFGSVKAVQILANRKNNSCGNIGFVTFVGSAASERAVLSTRHFLHCRYLKVEVSTSPDEQNPKITKADYAENSTEDDTRQIFLRPSLPPAQGHASSDIPPVHLRGRSPFLVDSANVSDEEGDFGTLADNEAARRRQLTKLSIPECPYPHKRPVLYVQRPRHLPAENCQSPRRVGPNFRKFGLPHCQPRIFYRRIPSGKLRRITNLN